MQNRQENDSINYITYARNAVIVAGLVAIAGSAFPSNVARFIKRRDGGCVARDKNCAGGLEASHYDHDKSDPEAYKSPNNGDTRCTYHHGIEHEINEGNNGLTIDENRWALMTIAGRLARYIGDRGHKEHYDFIDRNIEP